MKIEKASGRATVHTPSEEELAAINGFALEPLTAEQVFTFSVNACDDQVDREFEQFTVKALEGLAKLFVGKPMLFDHTWSAKYQTARVYRAEVVEDGTVHRLRLDLYMLANPDTEGIRQAILGGILREVSVGCAVAKATCSICGRPYRECGHSKGQRYEGKQCVARLEDPKDAYELSFVAVPATKEAGVVKCANAKLVPDDEDAEEHKRAETLSRARARLELRKKKINI